MLCGFFKGGEEMYSLFVYIFIVVMMVILLGVDIMFVMKNIFRYGVKVGWYNIFGLVIGFFFWMVIVILGLLVVIVKLVFFFIMIKYLGVVYLIYLGIKSFFVKSMFFIDDM